MKKYKEQISERLKFYDSENRKLKSQLRDIKNKPSDKRKIQAWGDLLSIFEEKAKAVQNSKL